MAKAIGMAEQTALLRATNQKLEQTKLQSRVLQQINRELGRLTPKAPRRCCCKPHVSSGNGWRLPRSPRHAG
jgi:hypothetical protein